MEIVKIPSPILAKKTKIVRGEEIKSGNHRQLIEEMRNYMIEARGVGLAANQVDQNISLFVIDQNISQEQNVPDVFFNPEIYEYSKARDELEEGCLSIPGQYHMVQRAKKIKLKAIDEKGDKIKIKARGFLARILQHETDHLNGLTIKDRGK